jgi:predicted TIM-barrel fold metal-dependent hydrolase
MITDCHIHIQPMEMFKPHALELMKHKRPNFDQIVEFCRSPKAFLKFLDASEIDRAMLINYVAPEVIGFTSGVNQFVADYVKEDPKRLLSCGSLHPRHTTNVLADVEQILRLGLQMIKIHPPHQLLFPNDYLSGAKELEIIYRAAEANGVPVMFHTGTSIFPGARNKYGDLRRRRRRGFSQAQDPARSRRPPALDADRILPGPPPSQLTPRYQRHTSKDPAEVFSAPGRDRA